MDLEVKNFEMSSGLKKVALSLIGLGIISIIASFSINKTVAWVDYLVNSIYFVTLGVSGIFFLLITGILQASWVTPYKRIPEAMTTFLPYGFVLMLLVFFGAHTIYEWTHHDVVMNDPILSQKTAWLNTPGFMIRMVIFFGVWIFISWRQRSLSDSIDQNYDRSITQKIIKCSSIGLIFYAFSICFASFDWLMSIEPHWFSTIYGVYFFSGAFLTGVAFVTLAIIKLQKWGYLKNVITNNHYHDLGKWMFGFSTFWAYIWLSQYLLIWYANIPEETEYYMLRHHHWNTMFFVNVILNWAIPFFGLMSREAKRNKKRLALIASIILVGHFVDLYLMAAPKVFEHHNVHVTGFGILQLLQWLGFFGLFIFVVGKALSKRKLVSVNDPNFEEGKYLHQ